MISSRVATEPCLHPNKCLSRPRFRQRFRKHARPIVNRNGSLLLVVLVTVAILALTVFSFASMMLVEEEAARVMTRRIQSKYLTASGVEYTRLYLAKSDDEIFESGGRWDNAGRFRGVPVVADVNDQGDEKSVGRFTLVAPNLNDGLLEGRRYGLVDESSKININALPYFDFYVENSGRDLLMSLPDMTEEIADAILDFVDADDEEREYGTESGYYNGLNPPYNAKNGPLDSLDELLLVNGITPELLFGLDINRNGVLDDEEASLGNVSLSDSDLFLGWANFLTLYSKETNLNPEGVPRVNINADDLDQLYDDLKSVFDDDWANFILLMRINGPSAVPDPESDTIVRGAAIPFEIPEDATGDNKFASVLDLMDQFVVTEDSEGNEVYVESPLTFIGMGPTLPLVMRSMTVYEGPSIPGRINLMQAPRRILEGVPGMTEDLLEEIIQRREYELDDPKFLDLNRNFETWILAEGLLGIGPEALERMKVLMPYLCAGGDVYRAEIVGYFGDGRGTSRSEVVFDTTVPVPKILLWRDKSHLQTGYSVEALGSELEAVGGNANGRN